MLVINSCHIVNSNTMRLVLADKIRAFSSPELISEDPQIGLQIQKTLCMYTVQQDEEVQKLNQFKQLHPRC